MPGLGTLLDGWFQPEITMVLSIFGAILVRRAKNGGIERSGRCQWWTLDSWTPGFKHGTGVMKPKALSGDV